MLLSGILATAAVGIGAIACVAVAVMVGLGSGTVRKSEDVDVTWPAVVLAILVVGGSSVLVGLLDGRGFLLDKVAELPWGVGLPDGAVVLIALPVVVSMLLLSVEEGPGVAVAFPPVRVTVSLLGAETVEERMAVAFPTVGVTVSVSVLLSVEGGVAFPPVEVTVSPLGPGVVVVIVGVLIVIPVVGPDSGVVGVVIEGGVVGGGADGGVGLIIASEVVVSCASAVSFRVRRTVVSLRNVKEVNFISS